MGSGEQMTFDWNAKRRSVRERKVTPALSEIPLADGVRGPDSCMADSLGGHFSLHANYHTPAFHLSRAWLRVDLRADALGMGRRSHDGAPAKDGLRARGNVRVFGQRRLLQH